MNTSLTLKKPPLYLKILKLFLFPILLFYLEFLLHLFAYRSLSPNIIWSFLFSCTVGFFLSFLTSLFPKKVNEILTYLFTFMITLIFEIQLVYFEIFKGFAPVSSAKLGGQAVTNFSGALLEGIRSSLLWILLLLLPFLLLCLFGFLKRLSFTRVEWKKALLPLAFSGIILIGTLGSMALFFQGPPSLYESFNSSSISTDASVRTFGLNITMLQECRWLIFSSGETLPEESLSTEEYTENDQVDPALDFSTLYKQTKNKKLKTLTAALSNMPVSEKNSYTGLLEGYNLISICAEAFSPELIDPELTPTLYALSNNGFIFENFYAGFPNTTTNGEYAYCMGLFPDLSREKTDSSFGLSASNYLPYCYGNLFKSNGARAYAYHNYVAEFYHRDYTHTNMGYEFTAANTGLDIDITWPSSDYDMMVASVDDYINSGEQFVAYYMTFSGHYQYTLENAMSAKNWAEVMELPYSDAVKAYIACNLELEKALTYLMERLEEAGIADKTVIILTTDHYPYGLTDEEYSELAGREINTIFDKLRSSFICYVPGMEPVQIRSYCSTIDILPTMLNLFGFTYDSRLLAGQDILANNVDHIAVLADGSFITDDLYYDASALQYFYNEETSTAKERASSLHDAVKKKFLISTAILNNDYYSFAYAKESSTEEIDDPTTQYTDVGIMEQASIYYLLTHELMDPVSKHSFGLWEPCSTEEMLDIFYRLAGQPEPGSSSRVPFIATRKYRNAMLWAYENGILQKDDEFPQNLKEDITVGQAALLLSRAARYFGIQTEPEEAVLVQDLQTRYPALSKEMIQASLFCRNSGIIIGDGKEEYVFYTSSIAIDRAMAANMIYRLCTYYDLAE